MNEEPQTGLEKLPGQPLNEPIETVVIGQLSKPVGVLGEMGLRPVSNNLKRWRGLKEVIVQVRDVQLRLAVRSWRAVGAGFRIAFVGVNSPETAARLTNLEVSVPVAARAKIDKTELYIDDLMTCAVKSEAGEYLGRIVEVYSQAHHDVWEVRGPRGEFMVPAVADFIAAVDMDRRLVMLKSIKGLWNEIES